MGHHRGQPFPHHAFASQRVLIRGIKKRRKEHEYRSSSRTEQHRSSHGFFRAGDSFEENSRIKDNSPPSVRRGQTRRTRRKYPAARRSAARSRSPSAEWRTRPV